MVILFSERKSKQEKEIIEILEKYGADCISDKFITQNENAFTVISVYKMTKIKLRKGIAVFTEKTHRFFDQKFPIGVIGICEENNKSAFEAFKKNNIAVITCGNNNKNTVTLSSINNNALIATVQRVLIDNAGNRIEPCEFKISLTKKYSEFSVMASACILLLNGIKPQEF